MSKGFGLFSMEFCFYRIPRLQPPCNISVVFIKVEYFKIPLSEHTELA